MLSFDSKQNFGGFSNLEKDKKNMVSTFMAKKLKSAANLDEEHNHKI